MKTLVISLLGVVLLSACSTYALNNKYRQTAETIKLATIGHDDQALTKEELADYPYGLLYVVPNNRSQVMLGLSAVYQQERSWISGDGSMLVTRDGLITQVLGLPNALAGIDWVDEDPFALGLLNVPADKSYASKRHHLPSYQFDVPYQSSFSKAESSTIEVAFTQYPVTKVIETISSGDAQWQNVYWVTNDGRVVKSDQLSWAGGIRFETQLAIDYKEE